MPHSQRLFLLFLMLIIGFNLPSCSRLSDVRRNLHTVENFQKMDRATSDQVKKDSPYLKAHMRNGNIYIFKGWSVDSTRQFLQGAGWQYNLQRDVRREGRFELAMDSVALLETNQLEVSPSFVFMTVLTGISVGGTIACISNPKACFGSCPTFYTTGHDSLQLRAEGFSSSISPSLEATDVDALFITADPGKFEIEMRNEAQETHVVRQANLLVVPRRGNERILADTQGRFWSAQRLSPPLTASAPEGDCRNLLSLADGKERFSPADSTDLSAKEFIELEFNNNPQAECGLVIGCRQTLLTTYLLYQAFAYMGRHAGYWLAEIERQNLRNQENSVQELIGGIEVQMLDNHGRWQTISEINEHGPLAVDFHLLPLGRQEGERVKVRLRQTKGNWRIDYTALAEMNGTVQPVRLQPALVINQGRPDETARRVLCDTVQALTTLPGDTYTLVYNLPEGGSEYEVFLESRGYYLEWMRLEWQAEESADLLAEFFARPEQALKRMAPEFKKVENQMERNFWGSRYAKPY